MGPPFRLLILLVAVLGAQGAAAQQAGEFRVGLTFGLPAKTGLSLRYYVADGVGPEAYAHFAFLMHTGVWFGGGLALNVHPDPDAPYYVVASYSQTYFALSGGYPPSPDAPGRSAKRGDFAVGLGAELASDRDSLYVSGAAGLNVNVWRTTRIAGPEGPYVDGPTTHGQLQPYFEAGIGFRSPVERGEE